MFPNMKAPTTFAAIAAVSGTIVAAHQGAEHELLARHDTVTVTVTATTCPQPLTIGYPPTSIPVVTLSTTGITTYPTAPGGYGTPPVVMTSSSSIASVPHVETTPVVSTTSTKTSSVETFTTESSTHTTTVSTTSSVSSTRPVVTPTLPPAVGGAVKTDLHLGMMALLGVVALY